MPIHETAYVDPQAEVHASATIGPLCYVGPEVAIGAETELVCSVTVRGQTRIGCGNRIFPGAVLGTPPQDISYDGEPTRLVIGDRNTVREGVTINRGTTKENRVTIVGSGCYLMACSHVAHDCIVGDNVILGNNVLPGGHVHIESGANINGGAAIHPFTTVGRLAYVGGLTRIVQDVPPFMILEGHPSRVRGVNTVGLRRNGMPEEVTEAIAKAYRRIFRDGRPRAEVLEEMAGQNGWPNEVRYLCRFLKNTSEGKAGRYREGLRRRG